MNNLQTLWFMVWRNERHVRGRIYDKPYATSICGYTRGAVKEEVEKYFQRSWATVRKQGARIERLTVLVPR
jgi:hypothetical protein